MENTKKDVDDIFIMLSQIYIETYYQMLTIFTLINSGAIIAILSVLKPFKENLHHCSFIALKISLLAFIVALILMAISFIYEYTKVLYRYTDLKKHYLNNNYKKFCKIYKKEPNLIISKIILWLSAFFTAIGILIAVIIILWL